MQDTLFGFPPFIFTLFIKTDCFGAEVIRIPFQVPPSKVASGSDLSTFELLRKGFFVNIISPLFLAHVTLDAIVAKFRIT